MNRLLVLRQRQSGFVLLLSVLLLSVFGLMVGTAFSASQWQFRVQGNRNAEELALLAARSAQQWAERWLLSQEGSIRPLPCPAQCQPGQAIWSAEQLSEPAQKTEIWWLDNAMADGFEPASGIRLEDRKSPRTPLGRWVISELHISPKETDTSPSTVVYYRITARAARTAKGTPVVLESIIARPFGDVRLSIPLSEPAASARFCLLAGPSNQCGRMAWRRIL